MCHEEYDRDCHRAENQLERDVEEFAIRDLCLRALTVAYEGVNDASLSLILHCDDVM